MLLYFFGTEEELIDYNYYNKTQYTTTEAIR